MTHRPAAAIGCVLLVSCGQPADRPAPSGHSDTDAVAAAPPRLAGTWTVVGHRVAGAVSPAADVDATAWHRRTIRLTADAASVPGSRCESPIYTQRSAALDSLLPAALDGSPAALDLSSPGDRVTFLRVECEGRRWAAPGGLLIEVGPDRTLAPWRGVFFELARDPDRRPLEYRALGQEPGWLLEISEEGRLRFAWDYGGSEVTVPVPTREEDERTGATIYETTTRAGDLRVRIEPRACTDVMSGARYESEVTVTLAGRTYKGCGWPADPGGR